MNRTEFIGRISAEPELRVTEGGSAVLKFTLAVSRYIKGQTDTDWIQCTAFGKQAENIAKYCSKGSHIGITGNIRTGKFERDGETHYTWSVWVESAEFLGTKRDKPDAPAFEAVETDIPF